MFEEFFQTLKVERNIARATCSLVHGTQHHNKMKQVSCSTTRKETILKKYMK